MVARFGCLSILPWILFAQMSWDQGTWPVLVAAVPIFEIPPEIDDRGAVFSLEVKREARQTLSHLRAQHQILILIETVASLEGKPIGELARQRARPLGADGLYVLVAGQDRDVAVVMGRNRVHRLLEGPELVLIRNAFLQPLRAGKADASLEQGVELMGATLSQAARAHPSNTRDRWLPFAIVMTFLGLGLVFRSGWSREDWYRRRRRLSPLVGRTVVPTGSC
jgi:uncharacterized protein